MAALEGPIRVTPHVRSTDEPLPFAPLSTDALVERGRELSAIDVLIAQLLAGRGGRLVIDGPAGIGKSTLLAFAAERAAAAGVMVRFAQASELSGQVAFAAARELLGEDWPDDAASSEAVAAGARATFDLAEQGPLLLMLDDVQWADAPTVRWLALLSASMARRSIALAVAVRAGDRPAGVLAELLDDRRAKVLRPAPLTAGGVATVLGERLGSAVSAELVDACHADTGGNPFLLMMLADALRQAGLPAGPAVANRIREVGSRALNRTVIARMDTLDDATRRLLEAAAVAGAVMTPSELAPVAAVSETGSADAARRLVGADLLRSVGSGEIAHPLVAAAIRDVMGAERREELARAAAVRLAAQHRVEEAGALLLEVAGRGDDAVVAVLLAAARAASQKGAPDVAAVVLRRALQEPPSGERRAEVLAELGGALLAAGDATAPEVLRDALAFAQDPARMAALAGLLALSLVYGLRLGDAVAVLDEVAARLADTAPALAEELSAQALQYSGMDAQMRAEYLRRLGAGGMELGASELALRMRLAEHAVESHRAGRPASETAALAKRALAAGLLLTGAPGSHANATIALIYSGEPAAGRLNVQDAIARFRTAGDRPMLALQYAFHAEARRLEGDMLAVERDVRTARELLPGGDIGPPFMVASLLESLLEQDEIAAAEQELRSAGMTGELPELVSTGQLFYARGRIRVAAGAVSLGLEDLLAAGAMNERFQIRDPQTVPWRVAAAAALLELGERERAHALSAEQLELARRFGAPHAVGPALRQHGVVIGGTEGCELARAAVAELEGSFARLELARALVDLAALTGEAAPAAQVRELLGRAATLAESLGSIALARRASDQLVRAGGRPRRPRRLGWRGLTATEQRVARLATQGLSNREIAETLVVSEKTIETHLTSIYRKLGVRSRAELPASA